jgi:hypothetical protein
MKLLKTVMCRSASPSGPACLQPNTQPSIAANDRAPSSFSEASPPTDEVYFSYA